MPLAKPSLIISALLLLMAPAGWAAEVRVAVAANFAAPMARIAESFRAATGHELKLASGATGKFYAQIVNGAPFEVLLAADAETPRRLLAEGHGVPGSAFTYAIGRLVLWSPQPGRVDGQGKVLANPAIRRVAIANPEVAPYGAAAMEVLQARGLVALLQPKLATAQSIAQAHQFVASGNADIGFVALSQVMKPGEPLQGSQWLVPAELHRPIRQDALLLKKGADNPGARALMEYLRGDTARRLIAAYGYGF